MLSSFEDQPVDLEWVSTWQGGIEAIRRASHDVCLLDYRIGGGDGLELLKESRRSPHNIPVVLLTGVADYPLDVEAMELGAADFLVKDQITQSLLERSIRYAITQARSLDELRRQQDELRASELRFRSVVQSAADAIILMEENSKIIFWNKGAETLFGYREDEVIGAHFESLIPEPYREDHRAGLERFRVTGRSSLVGNTTELEGLRKDSTIFPIELSLASWSSNEGTYFTGIVRDFTERRRNEELRRAKDAAEQASLAKSSFVARMSHELRTPLHAIVGFTGLLLQNKTGNLISSDIDFLQRILLNAQDQLQLINTILDLSKIEAGRLEVSLAPTSLDSVIRDVVKQLQGQSEDRKVDIELCLPQTVKPVLTDTNKIKQVLVNLIDNAVKYSREGRVLVELVISPLDFQPLRIDVIDTGIGIPPEHLQDIFEPFFQIKEPDGKPSAGTGLGLSITRSLCDLLGCHIEVQSAEGKGSTFSVIFPVQESDSLWEKVG
jgi:PAS domain S-box-containing protein